MMILSESISLRRTPFVHYHPSQGPICISTTAASSPACCCVLQY
ncbi:hypothetical protein OIU76_027442, partial [Salix suchowensis]